MSRRSVIGTGLIRGALIGFAFWVVFWMVLSVIFPNTAGAEEATISPQHVVVDTPSDSFDLVLTCVKELIDTGIFPENSARWTSGLIAVLYGGAKCDKYGHLISYDPDEPLKLYHHKP